MHVTIKDTYGDTIAVSTTPGSVYITVEEKNERVRHRAEVALDSESANALQSALAAAIKAAEKNA